MVDFDSGPSRADVHKYAEAVHSSSGEDYGIVDEALDERSTAYLERADVAASIPLGDPAVLSTWHPLPVFSYEKWLGTTGTVRH